MGLLRRGREAREVGGYRYVMRERLLGIGDDYWIESDDGQRAFKGQRQGPPHQRHVRHPGTDPVLILAITVAVDAMSHD
jgi:uncharacterized protein YxjI